MNLESGEKVDRFVVDGVIGAGGTATVYRVRHESLGTPHALKVLSLSGDLIRDRLLVEGQAQASLNHPNIVNVTDILDVRGQPGLLMEHIDGPALDDALRQYRFDLDQIAQIFLGILDGVEAAHALGLVHRDLKLANVLLVPNGPAFVPKVADFGLAKVLHNRPKEMTATRQGVAMGTPGFMAPEQVRDAGNVDQRADLFSLGCILYEMVTGRAAFPGEEILEIYLKVTKVKYVPVRTYAPDLPDTFEAAIRGCLQKSLDDRIPDIATLRSVLLGHQGWMRGTVPSLVPMADVDPPVALRPSQIPSSPSLAPASIVPGDPPTADRVLPILLVGGSLALLLLVMVFAVLGVGVPLLLSAQKPVPVDLAPAVRIAEPVESVPVVDPVVPEPTREFENPIERRPPAPKVVVQAPAPVRREYEDPLSALPRELRERSRPAAPETVWVRLLSKPPSASLRIDGRRISGRTPSKIRFVEGQHRVDMAVSGMGEMGFDLVVSKDSPSRWCADFVARRMVRGNCPP